MTRICDFCQATVAPWNIPSENFTFEQDPMIGSDGTWAACDACQAYVAYNDRGGLVEHIVAGFIRRHAPGAPDYIRRAVRDRVEALTKQFWAAKTGDPVPFAPSIDGDTQRS